MVGERSPTCGGDPGALRRIRKKNDSFGKMARMKSLVTGGAGFIGSHVARHLVNAGHEVTLLDDLSGGYERNVPEGTKFVKGTINDVALIDSVFESKKFDYVFHLAAYAAEGLSHFIRRFNYDNNVIGSINLINAAVNAGTVKCFVFTSSIAVYGHLEDAGIESDPLSPIDPYGCAKMSVEYDLRAAHEMFGLDYVIFRPHNVYGPNQNLADPYRNVIGIFYNQAMQDKPFTIFGDGSQTRAFSYIDDVAPIIARSVDVPESYGKVFNVGGRERYTVKQVAEEVSASLGVPVNITNLPERNEAKHAWSNHDLCDSIFGTTPGVPLEVGIKQMGEWAKEVGIHAPSELHMDIEVSRNMPPSWAALLESQKKS